MVELYREAFWGIWLLLITILIQGMVAAVVKASAPDAIPGKMDTGLSHDSFVFRANRTFLNSLENLPLMLGTSFLAIFIGVSSGWTAVLIWVMAVSRLLHMLLYYQIATEKNPSPRSYFFLLALLANVILLVLCAVHLF